MDIFDWLLVSGLVIGLYMAWNIGANDVANAMGTSVGSAALTIAQAICIAAVFEFVGAVFVGGHVTETVKKGIVDIEQLADPTQFVVVMLAALLAAGLWLQVATWKGLPVSTTHSIVGGVAGAGVAAAGMSGVHWSKLAFIGVSWVLSPLLGGLIAFLLFKFVSSWIINTRAPLVNVRRAAPFLAGIVVLVLFLSLLFKGFENLDLHFSFSTALGWATALGCVAAAITALYLRRTPPSSGEHGGGAFGYVERQFRWLQILTACYVAFAHGANDVANAVGPLAGIHAVWKHGTVAPNVGVPIWILVVGGLGIVVGLATYGYRVMETVGRRITELVPSRGFSAEFAAATTVLVCTKFGLPISTTHTLVGSVIGVGLARGLAALDMRVVRQIVSAWVVTLPVAFVMSAVIFYALSALVR